MFIKNKIMLKIQPLFQIKKFIFYFYFLCNLFNKCAIKMIFSKILFLILFSLPILFVNSFNFDNNDNNNNNNLSGFIVEPKLSVSLLDSLLNARNSLQNAPIYLVTHKRNYNFFQQPIWRGLLNVHLLKQFPAPTSKQGYSTLMTSCKLWNSLNSTYVIVFQADSRFCSTSK